MLIACAVVSVGLAVAHFATKDYRRRLAICDDIGARYVWGSVNSIMVTFHGPVASREIEKYQRIFRIDFEGTLIEADWLENLTGLEYIGKLIFIRCSIDGPGQLAPLSAMSDVRTVMFWNTCVTDAAIDVIAQTPGMEVAVFWNTSVTQAGADRLRALRPGVTVRLLP